MNALSAKQHTAFEPDATNGRLLRDAYGRFATGVTVITTLTDSGPVATTANSFSSVSMDPPLVLWSPDRNSRRFGHFASARTYAIHVLAADQEDLCWRIARDAYGLRSEDYHLDGDDIPVLTDCLARFDCEQHAVFEGGDHAIVVGRVKRASFAKDRQALGFFGGQIGTFAPKPD